MTSIASLARRATLGLAAAGLSIALAASPARAQNTIQLTKIGGYAHGGFAVGASEIVAHDPSTQRLFVVNAQAATVDILDIDDPSDPTLVGTIDVSPYGAVANGVAVSRGVVAVAIENADRQANGSVALFTTGGAFLSSVTVGALPDMLTFTPNGDHVLVANEGEPNASYTVDPEGSVSIIDVRAGAASVTQSDVRSVVFSAYTPGMLDASVRVFGPGATVAQDVEPEYIAVSHNSQTAWVTLQENNAIAVIDIRTAAVTSINGLGFKDHTLAANALDPSDRDGGIRFGTWPVFGMYLPDAIATFKEASDTYLVLANEGDARAYTGYDEERRVGQLTLDPTAFPNGAVLKANANIGRLRVTGSRGDVDGDGDYDQLYSFGARSFSIRDAQGALVYDSGDDLEQITAAAYPSGFNSTNDANGSFDTRSDDKGPEPEGLAVGKVSGTTYAFVGLERIGGVAVFDISTPAAPVFVQYVNSRDFSGSATLGTAGDLGPEGLHFISEDDSPIGSPLLVVGNEISGTTAIFEIGQSSLGRRTAGRSVQGAAITSITRNGGILTIGYASGGAAEVELAIVDARGRTVTSVAGSGGTATIEAGVPATGAYYLLLRADGVTCDMRPAAIAR